MTSYYSALPLWYAIVCAIALLCRKLFCPHVKQAFVGLDLWWEIMPENMYTDPSITPEGQVNVDYNESTVDIYVSTESLKVYENPWVEATSSNTPGPGETQHPGMEETGIARGLEKKIIFILILFTFHCVHLNIETLVFNVAFTAPLTKQSIFLTVFKDFWDEHGFFCLFVKCLCWVKTQTGGTQCFAA